MAIEEGGGIPPKDDGNNFFHPPIMDSVINETVPEIPLVIRKEIVKLCAMACHDLEESIDTPNSPETWENVYKDYAFQENLALKGAKAVIEKFCELEGIKQEFKGPSYRLAGPWRKP